MTMTTLINVKKIIVVAYIFRGIIHYHHGRVHGGMQAKMVLEK